MDEDGIMLKGLYSGLSQIPCMGSSSHGLSRHIDRSSSGPMNSCLRSTQRSPNAPMKEPYNLQLSWLQLVIRFHGVFVILQRRSLQSQQRPGVLDSSQSLHGAVCINRGSCFGCPSLIGVYIGAPDLWKLPCSFQCIPSMGPYFL